MNKKYAIFDMDGTLVNSMIYWQQLDCEFLKSRGISEVSQELLERLTPMTIIESAELFINELGVDGTIESIADEINSMMAEHYKNNVQIKSGAKEYLDSLYKNGVKMCIASATSKRLVKACLKRLDILKYFEFLLSCDEVNAGKNKPDVYLEAAKRLCSDISDTAIFEDAVYAVKTAKKAGFYVVGVYDVCAQNYWEEIKTIADETILSYDKA